MCERYIDREKEKERTRLSERVKWTVRDREFV